MIKTFPKTSLVKGGETSTPARKWKKYFQRVDNVRMKQKTFNSKSMKENQSDTSKQRVTDKAGQTKEKDWLNSGANDRPLTDADHTKEKE